MNPEQQEIEDLQELIKQLEEAYDDIQQEGDTKDMSDLGYFF